MCLPRDSRRLCVLHQNKEIIRNSNSFFQGKAPKEVVPTHPRSLFLHTNPAFVGEALAHTDLAFVGVFGAHTDPTDLTDFFDGEKSHGGWWAF